MTIDENDFFRQVTTRVCGSLDIKTALANALQYLQHFIPLNAMGLHLYEPELHAMRTIARVGPSGSFTMDKLTPLSAAVKRGDSFDKVQIFNRPEEDLIIKTMIPQVKVSPYSVMILHLSMDRKSLGTLSLRAEGKDRYNRDHAQLLSLAVEPFSIAMDNALKHRELSNLKDRLADDNLYLRKELRTFYGDRIIGEHSGLKEIMAMVRQVAPLNSPVLLLGETGVGKDVIANAIHYSSKRRGGPFIKVNCGAIPETLLDSELFGHEKGAFTGAGAQKRGRFERAHNGTIFLDEVGELLPQAQVRMLRVLQDREIERIGSAKPIQVDIRLITATNRNLEEMARSQQFRPDLWFRLNVFPIYIPPLRERKADIPAFAEYFLSKKSRDMNLSSVPKLDTGTMKRLLDYDWPGNVRELENVIERALILNRERPYISADSLIPGESGAVPCSSGGTEESLDLDTVIAGHIRKVLQHTDGRVHGPDGAARLLGINASTLRKRMSKLGIEYGRRFRKHDAPGR